jgi:hypothetical protein
MNILEPLRMYLSSCLTARVLIPLTSEPASGSVRQKEQSRGSSVSRLRYFFFVSSEPPRSTGAEPRPLLARVVPIPEQPQPNSSSISDPER